MARDANKRRVVRKKKIFRNRLPDRQALPNIRHPADAALANGNSRSKNAIAKGVDGSTKGCRMGGSPGTKCFGAIFKRRLQVIDL